MRSLVKSIEESLSSCPMIVTKTITADSNLQQLVDEINAASWDTANEMHPFDIISLQTYLRHDGTVFVACHELVDRTRTLLGIASARLEVKPYASGRWLYVDEIDVCANQRRKGAGRAMMKELLAIARQAGCAQVWLATEPDNEAANALYCSLDPHDVEQVVGYTYDLQSSLGGSSSAVADTRPTRPGRAA